MPVPNRAKVEASEVATSRGRIIGYPLAQVERRRKGRGRRCYCTGRESAGPPDSDIRWHEPVLQPKHFGSAVVNGRLLSSFVVQGGAPRPGSAEGVGVWYFTSATPVQPPPPGSVQQSLTSVGRAQ